MPLGSLSGDTAKLVALRKGLDRLGEQGFKQAVGLVAARASGLVRQGFDASRDPYGASWAPTVAGNRPLVRTGALRSQASQLRPSANGVRVTISLPYAGYHLTGTRRMPARPFLPMGPSLPPSWIGVIERSMGAILAVYLPA